MEDFYFLEVSNHIDQEEFSRILKNYMIPLGSQRRFMKKHMRLRQNVPQMK